MYHLELTQNSPNPSQVDLPAYTPPELLSSKSLAHKGSPPWLTLNMKSSHIATSSSQNMPLYKKPGSSVSGDITLMLDKPETIQAVKVSIRGISSSAAGGSSTYLSGSVSGTPTPVLARTFTFLEVTETLWSTAEGPPVHAEPPPWGFPTNGKLQGKYTFPFTLHLPLEFASESPRPKDAPLTYSLPPSWYDKKNPAAIDYDILVTIVRGALKVNNTLSLNFIYAPHTRPGPPSDLRKISYARGTTVPDPLGDPSGWQTIQPPPKIKGKLANGKAVEVVCMFALAKPLTYSRGSFIPINLSFQSSDSQVLDLLQSPAAISILLLQSIITGKNAHGEGVKISREVYLSPVARSICWPATNAVGQWDDCRMVMGEIPLPKKIPPTIISPRAIVRYSVVMLPFDVAGFTPSDSHKFIVDQPVDIATNNAEGPPPVSQIPEGYNDPRKDVPDRFEHITDPASQVGYNPGFDLHRSW